MKRIVVFAGTGAVIAALFVASLAAERPRFAVRESRYRADDAPASAPVLSAPPSAPAPPPPMEVERSMPKPRREALKKELLGGPVAAASVGEGANDFLGAMQGLGAVHGVGAGGGGLGAGVKGLGSIAAGGEAPAAATRAWFPQTFLFEPLVVTDAQGHAEVPVKVPDRLTSWRVLALAHSRQGAQAGALTTFLGTLPTYVEPVTPAFLYAGDQVRLPVQVVNTTGREVTARLQLSASGAVLSSAGGPVRVPAAGDVVQYTGLSATRPGKAVLRATLGSTDAVEKDFPVKPAGLQGVQARGGTLATARTFTLTGPADTLPGTEALRVRVFPGALGLVRAELAAAPGRGGVAEDAYLLQLLGQAPALLRALGATPDEPLIRELTLLATQRVMRHARAPSADAATLLAEAAASHPESPVLQRAAERLANQVAKAQRADGTCQGETGWTLQRLLVATADCVRAARAASAGSAGTQRATRVTVKAAGAFERNLNRVADGYTAAAVLASGTVSAPGAAALKKLVLDHLLTAADGARYLEVAQGVVRADGRPPSTYEATALAVLALGDDPVVADLGTWLLAGYSASWGWGDGRANLVGLRAALQLFKDPVPAGVTVTVSRDGKPLAAGTLDAAALQDVLSLDADATGSVGEHLWSISAQPPVPGLGYSLQLVAFTPWKASQGGGLTLTAALPAALQVGHAAELALTAGVPGNTPMQLKLPLPAGVQADTPSLDALVSAGKVARYETEDGLVTLHLGPQRPGAVYAASLKVVPTLAGRLQSGPPSLAPEASPQLAKAFAPTTWTVKE
jgi:Alpha-2-macroglobulin family